MARSYISEKDREAVFFRAKGLCEYCHSQEAFPTQRFSVEHVIPKSKGGSNKFENLALACQGCNNFKYTKNESDDPVSGKTVPIFNPRTQIWGNHFTWNEDFSQMLGLTPTGRATILSMKLNRQMLINLRKAMHLIGEHP